MARPSPSAMNAGGVNGGGDGNGPAGTEYTLQGRVPSVDTTQAMLEDAARLTAPQGLCASCSSNGTTTNAPGMPGTLSGPR